MTHEEVEKPAVEHIAMFVLRIRNELLTAVPTIYFKKNKAADISFNMTMELTHFQQNTIHLDILFLVFTPSLIFPSLVDTVAVQDIISMWFMPINIGITFICGGMVGWITIKLIKPKPHLEDLIIAMCSTGNFANLLLILIPAICMYDGSPFGDHDICMHHSPQLTGKQMKS